MAKKRLHKVYVSILCQLLVILAYETDDDLEIQGDENLPVQVRAVFLNCETDDKSNNEQVRFEREELFRHNALKDCSKKLALTVKITSEVENSGDEYLPIQHVFEGPNKKRIRLLDPYILRLRRDTPLQAYKLRKLEVCERCVICNYNFRPRIFKTVSGVLMHSVDQVFNKNHYKDLVSRVQRDAVFELSDINYDDVMTPTKSLSIYPALLQPSNQRQPDLTHTTEQGFHELNDCKKVHSCDIINDTLNKRFKRNEHNIVIETVTDDDGKWIPNDYLNQNTNQDINKHTMGFEYEGVENVSHKSINPANIKEIYVTSKNIAKKLHRASVRPKNLRMNTNINSKGSELKGFNSELDSDNTTAVNIDSEERYPNKPTHNKIKEKKAINGGIISPPEKDYEVYEIGSPELWYSVHVQLFEKLSTLDGKAVWNDLTKGKTASVSSTSPEWRDQDLAVRYRSTKWIPRNEYFLPSIQLCLLVPNKAHADTYINDNGIKFRSYKYSDFVVLPEEDIVTVNEDAMKHNTNNSELESHGYSSEASNQQHRRVLVRTSRAIINGNQDTLTIASQGTEKFLTLKHRRPHHAQIDVEARADGNELIRIGSSGRVSIAVADSTRRTRTVLNFQVGNTGLAAARFRIEARDFDPLMSDLLRSKETTTGRILIPPRHTRSLRLELPIEMPVDMVRCSVALINDEDQSVAVRNVAIRKGDRCFCVWHCDCVCLGNDPKLMCRDMDEADRKAAGLNTLDRPRHARSVCYPDVATLNMFVIFIGVLLTLLLCGLVKAVLGLFCQCIGTWGLHQLLQTPRKLDRYYERSLRGRCVRYDEEGWPVHPDTCKRNVHLVGMLMQFFLNAIFFISVPCLILYEIIKQIFTGCRSSKSEGRCTSPLPNAYTKKCFNSQDMQGGPRDRRRREDLRRWMSSQAHDLSTEVWKKSLNVHTTLENNFMRPLLRDTGVHDSHVTHDSCQDSEQEDTDYVLMQMQKSRESLAQSQKKISDADPATVTASASIHKE